MRLSCFAHKAYVIQRPQYNSAVKNIPPLISKIINIYNEKQEKKSRMRNKTAFGK